MDFCTTDAPSPIGGVDGRQRSPTPQFTRVEQSSGERSHFVPVFIQSASCMNLHSSELRGLNRHPREAADRVPRAETVDTGIFIGTSRRTARCARSVGAAPPNLPEGARHTVGDQACRAERGPRSRDVGSSRPATHYSGSRSRQQLLTVLSSAPAAALLPLLTSDLGCGNESCVSFRDRSRLKVAARRRSDWITAGFPTSRGRCSSVRRAGSPTASRDPGHVPWAADRARGGQTDGQDASSTTGPRSRSSSGLSCGVDAHGRMPRPLLPCGMRQPG